MPSQKNSHSKIKRVTRSFHFWIFVIVLSFVFIIISIFPQLLGLKAYYKNENFFVASNKKEEPIVPKIPPLDKALYDQKLEALANNPIPEPVVEPTTQTSNTDTNQNVQKKVELDKNTEVQNVPIKKPNLWPVKTVYPKDGAILPFKRIIAYYGNLYSTRMGVLGEYKEEEMFALLQKELDKWNIADPSTPAIPALHYIVTTAQLSAGKDGKYRLRMPDSEIQKVLTMAQKIDAIVFLDVQVGFSTLQEELPLLEKYLKLPNVHLGIDPEFSMKGDIRPGKIVGTFDAMDINYAIDFLAKIVQENDLTPKVLVIHRYTQKMVTNYKTIKTLPEVQIVMHMDGWGPKAKKLNTYKQFVYKEPVQFAGFKIFYKNDLLEPSKSLITPEELMQITPIPIYIQYQ
ncbi:MAG: hypothetical protein K9L98_01860 [Candidatus Pacebacteria bacterium]|nr:hypothetical protein [Candidatus Paceibacterota bacterium]MCF7862733.1 hypothetical protein [Candidatus Paceibacterota bacterium]